jgi:geranylgeranyl pyrophosphate synthase
MGNIELKSSITFYSSAQEEIREIETLMRAQTQRQHPDLMAALDIILKSGGKRIRPTMAVLLGKMFGAPREKIITLGASIELLHTATLVHDDLIDGALLRRGNPTLNSQWSPAATVLSGDFLFACAAKLVADTECIPAIRCFSQTLQIIVNGEIAQLFDSRCNYQYENYLSRIYAKTASLFESTAKSTAYISDASADMVEAASLFGYEIGIAFQIVDDVLDFAGTESELGKPVGSDLKQGLITLPAIYYIQEHTEDPDVRIIRNGDCVSSEVDTSRLISSIRSSTAINKALDDASAHVQKGLTALYELPDSSERATLEEIATHVVARNF